MTSLTGCARPVKIDKFFTALLAETKIETFRQLAAFALDMPVLLRQSQ